MISYSSISEHNGYFSLPRWNIFLVLLSFILLVIAQSICRKSSKIFTLLYKTNTQRSISPSIKSTLGAVRQTHFCLKLTKPAGILKNNSTNVNLHKINAACQQSKTIQCWLSHICGTTRSITFYSCSPPPPGKLSY